MVFKTIMGAMEKDIDKEIDNKENSNFLEIKEQIKRQKDKEYYDKWMKEVLPIVDVLEPHLKSYVDEKYNNDFNRVECFFEVEQNLDILLVMCMPIY